MAERDDLIAQACDAFNARDGGYLPAKGTPGRLMAEAVVDAGWRPPAPAGEHAVDVVREALRRRLDAEEVVLLGAHDEQPFNDEQLTALLAGLATVAVKAMPRPEPAAPLFEGCIKGLDAGGEVTVRNSDHNPITEHIQMGTEVAVYRKGDVPARPWVARKMDTTHTGLAAAVIMEPGPAPTQPSAALDAAVRRVWTALGYDSTVGEPDALIGGLDTIGVTAPPRSLTERERWATVLHAADLDPIALAGAVDELMASGAKLPEPKVRWTMEDFYVVDTTLLGEDQVRVVCYQADETGNASVGDRSLAERVARLLAEEDERG